MMLALTWRDFYLTGGVWLDCPDPLCGWQENLETITLGDLQFVAQDHLDETHTRMRRPPKPKVFVRPRGICQVCGEEKTIDFGGYIYTHNLVGTHEQCTGSRRLPSQRVTR